MIILKENTVKIIIIINIFWPFAEKISFRKPPKSELNGTKFSLTLRLYFLNNVVYLTIKRHRKSWMLKKYFYLCKLINKTYTQSRELILFNKIVKFILLYKNCPLETFYLYTSCKPHHPLFLNANHDAKAEILKLPATVKIDHSQKFYFQPFKKFLPFRRQSSLRDRAVTGDNLTWQRRHVSHVTQRHVTPRRRPPPTLFGQRVDGEGESARGQPPGGTFWTLIFSRKTVELGIWGLRFCSVFPKATFPRQSSTFGPGLLK